MPAERLGHRVPEAETGKCERLARLGGAVEQPVARLDVVRLGHDAWKRPGDQRRAAERAASPSSFRP